MSNAFSKAFGTKEILSRTLFYGLFFLGPCLFTESHSIYVREKNKYLNEHSEIVATNNKKEYEASTKVKMLDLLGFSSCTIWCAWLIILIGFKMTNRSNDKGS